MLSNSHEETVTFINKINMQVKNRTSGVLKKVKDNFQSCQVDMEK